MTQTTFPSSLAETYAYDAIGNLTSKTDRKGQTITYLYDALNRLTQKTYPDSTSVEYVYDLVGKVMQVNDPTGTYGFAYDNMGRLIGTTTSYSFLPGQTFSNAYSYDAASNRTGFTAPDGSTNSYSYDTLNRLNNLTNSLTGSFGFSYDALSRRTQLTRPNGVNTNYAYDNLSRLLSVLHQSGSTTLDGANYNYDSVGNRVSKTNYLNNVTEGYSYDPLYQLTQVTQGASTSESYSYDAVGNRLSLLGVSPYTYNSLNELTATPSGSYTYDSNGNTTSKTDSSGTTSYGWDFENRLTQAMLPSSGGTVTFKYDPFGRRIRKTSANGTVNFLYDDANVIQEIDDSAGSLASYSLSGSIDEPLAILRSATPTYFEQDGIASLTSSSNASGGLVATYNYDSFGKLASSTGILANSVRYVGREFDSETGLYYYRARYYIPEAGRFMSEDPLGYGGGDVVLYNYVMNNTPNLNDPFGMKLNPKPGPGTQGGLDLSDLYGAINVLNKDPRAGQMVNALAHSATTYNIVFIHDGNDMYDPATHTIYWDPRSALYCTCGGGQSPANGLYHEMAHAAGGPQATAMSGIHDAQYGTREERRVIRTYEAPYSRRHGECVRPDHGGTPYVVSDPTSTTFVAPPVPHAPLPPGLQ